MRSLGCAINDIVDRKIDVHITRTKMRPLAHGDISLTEALFISGLLALIALVLVMQLNLYSFELACVAAVLTVVYPFMKRYTYFAQVVLGVVFNFGVLIAFTAIGNTLPATAYLLYFATIIWTVAYDTLYALADVKDDKKLNMKSMAVLLEKYKITHITIAVLQLIFIGALISVALINQYNFKFYIPIPIISFIFVRQHILIKKREPKKCMQAFRENHLVGCAIMLGFIWQLFM